MHAALGDGRTSCGAARVFSRSCAHLPMKEVAKLVQRKSGHDSAHARGFPAASKERIQSPIAKKPERKGSQARSEICARRREEIKKLIRKRKGLRNQNQEYKRPTLLEARLTLALYLQVNNNQLFQQVSTLEAQVMGDEQIKADFEEFKKREEDKVERRCAEMDARLDALSIDFDEELYPHMLTAIACRRWVIGHGLRLAVMKCVEFTDLRQAFANVVSARIAKRMGEGLKHGVEHGKAQLDLEVIEAYDPEVALLDLLLTCPYTWRVMVRDPRDPWVLKEEMMLEVPRITLGLTVFPVLEVPMFLLHGLDILFDSGCSLPGTEDINRRIEASPRLIRSKSLPPMYNLDWP
ncbi:hypothetical protein Tco_1337120 [Tanacetum coccineum]